jgi:hypothetical protein
LILHHALGAAARSSWQEDQLPRPWGTAGQVRFEHAASIIVSLWHPPCFMQGYCPCRRTSRLGAPPNEATIGEDKSEKGEERLSIDDRASVDSTSALAKVLDDKLKLAPILARKLDVASASASSGSFSSRVGDGGGKKLLVTWCTACAYARTNRRQQRVFVLLAELLNPTRNKFPSTRADPAWHFYTRVYEGQCFLMNIAC